MNFEHQSKIRIIETHHNRQFIQYEKKKINKSLYNNPHINNLHNIQKIQKINSIDSDSVQNIEPNLKYDQIFFDKNTIVTNQTNSQKIHPKKYFSYSIYLPMIILQMVSSLVQISLQIVLLVYNTPLNKISTGIWSGSLGLLTCCLMLSLVINQKHIWYITGLILNVLGLIVYISLIIINSFILSLYDMCTNCFYDSNYIGINITLMVLGLVSFTVCLFFILKSSVDKP